MQYWIHKILFFRLETSTFTIIYARFFTALVRSFAGEKQAAIQTTGDRQ